MAAPELALGAATEDIPRDAAHSAAAWRLEKRTRTEILEM